MGVNVQDGGQMIHRMRVESVGSGGAPLGGRLLAVLHPITVAAHEPVAVVCAPRVVLVPADHAPAPLPTRQQRPAPTHASMQIAAVLWKVGGKVVRAGRKVRGSLFHSPARPSARHASSKTANTSLNDLCTMAEGYMRYPKNVSGKNPKCAVFFELEG